MPHIVHIEAWACRSRIETPVATSFGIMRDRPAVFLRLCDSDGGVGWGEVFANWPAAGAEHRVNLLIDDIAPLVLGLATHGPDDHPQALSARLDAQTQVRALQCGEFGPFRQVLAGIDTALWDMAARRAGQTLAAHLAASVADGGAGAQAPVSAPTPVSTPVSAPAPTPAARVPAYASGIHIDAARGMVASARAQGFAAFKVKVGFDLARDAARLQELAADLGAGERLFCDANQAWSAQQAAEFMRRIEGAGIGWLEEPVRADCPSADWRRVRTAGGTPLAGGENIAGTDSFAAALDQGDLHYIQPDVAKWGGCSGCLDVARRALEAGRVYCPHFLGGGIGLAASAHLLAAAGGPGLLEVDVNPNPLRDAFATPADRMDAGAWTLGAGPGLGVEGLPDAVLRAVTLRREIAA